MPRKANRQDAPEQDAAERHEHIAVAAYYNAERRGFEAGGEVDDWVAAERQVDGRGTEKGPRGEAVAKQPDGAAGRADGNGAAADRPDYPDLKQTDIAHVEPDEVDKWARRLNVPAPRLREAMQRVGPVIRDIKRFLGASPS